jgi:hypothetical protein
VLVFMVTCECRLTKKVSDGDEPPLALKLQLT